MSSNCALSRAVSLRLRGVSFRYGDAVDVLRDVSLHLAPGWIGVVGPNGAGKTTLLRLLAGQLQPSEGTIQRIPDHAGVVVCPQEVTLDQNVSDFASDWDSPSQRWRRRLALDPADIDRWHQLSPGECRRWQMATALARDPAVLLLDEPSNHLDDEARCMLVDALRRHRGVGVMVSHDRTVLDELTTTTLRVAGGTVTSYAGRYSEAVQCWRAERATTLHDAARRTRQVRRARRQLAAARTARAGAERAIRSRPKSSRDSDGRSVARKGRAAKAEAAHAQRLSAMKTRVERAERDRGAVTIHREHGKDLCFAFEPAPQAILATIDQPLRAGSRVLCDQVTCTVRRTSRIHLRGRNGAGKTTLLEALRAAARVPAERMLLLPQELDRVDRRRCLDEARALEPGARGRCMQLMSVLGVDPAALLASELPSPGEARKLMIAAGLGRQVWCLLLDEPTNHLDLPSIERLEVALAAFPGAVVLVSHDSVFAGAICDEAWTLDGQLRT